MAIHLRSWFKDLFVPRYRVTAEDLDSLCDSVAFKNEDIASVDTLGLIKVGDNLSIDENGKLNADLPTPGYLVYRALLNQTGTDIPIATVLENTVGEVIYSRLAPGQFQAASPLFIAGKTHYKLTNNSTSSMFEKRINNENDGFIDLASLINGSGFDGQGFLNTPIEILIYP
jgi:hypothetical protein